MGKYSRRKFIQTSLGAAALLGLTRCDQVEDPLESYNGPEINELDFVSFNQQYHNVAVDAATQFPHSAIRDGALSGATDPVSIAYRLQYLIDIADQTAADALMDSLLAAQENSSTFIDFRGFIPQLEFANNSNGFLKSDSEFNLADNAALSARVAMAANAFTATDIEAKALTFLANQKEGYNYYLSGETLALPITGSALNEEISTNKINLLFGECFAELAFVFSYFVGDSTTIQDPQVGIDAWDNLIRNTPTSQHGDSFTSLITLSVPLSKNGSGYQYFHPLLAVPTSSISQTLSDALYNVLFSFLDAARAENLPGIYSGAPNIQGNFLEDNGLSRLTAPDTASSTRESIATVDALAAALRLFPEDSAERQNLRRWMGIFNETPGIQGTSGLYGGVDAGGNIAQSQFARQNAAMILFNSTAPNNLEGFLAANGKTSLADLFARIAFDVEGAPIQRVPNDLPLPPSQGQLFMDAMPT